MSIMEFLVKLLDKFVNGVSQERVREQALNIADNVALRAQQLEETVASNLQAMLYRESTRVCG